MTFSLLGRWSNLIGFEHAIFHSSCAFIDWLNYACNPQLNPHAGSEVRPMRWCTTGLIFGCVEGGKRERGVNL